TGQGMLPARDQIPNQAQALEAPECQIGDVQLPPAMEAVRGAARIGVMIVVPAIAVGCQRKNPVIAAVLVGLGVAVAPHVTQGVHPPSDVPGEQRPVDYTVQKQAQTELNATDPEARPYPADYETDQVKA